MAEPLAVLLLGPTGSGKTALSLVLGERFGGEIVSCDSVAVYREFEIGTAKPSREDRTRDDWGQFCYIRDLHTGVVWSAGHQLTAASRRSARPRSNIRKKIHWVQR